ncbi:MAG TPA: tRNA (adenosine(37)-N6)-threonylcarbamoyltransferase complex ATPase subunit type 1 TsaE [Armatimonadota bacterium]|nr:tRNA (adenosine(37)-N6)-threonylcarbamoyltransferase complex ATPase subunit type 1 TsaE [Armatimonadota bacterium]
MPGDGELVLTTRSGEETRALGEALGGLLAAGDVVCLSGELGAGKTVLAQGIGAGLGVTEPVSSPTFALAHEYRGRLPVWHLDVYRVRSLDELIDLSWQELLSGGGVVVIEWPERIAGGLPPDRLEVSLAYGDDDAREIRLRGTGPRAREVLAGLEQRSAPAGAPRN